jgi:hypothetical protein
VETVRQEDPVAVRGPRLPLGAGNERHEDIGDMMSVDVIVEPGI